MISLLLVLFRCALLVLGVWLMVLAGLRPSARHGIAAAMALAAYVVTGTPRLWFPRWDPPQPGRPLKPRR